MLRNVYSHFAVWYEEIKKHVNKIKYFWKWIQLHLVKQNLWNERMPCLQTMLTQKFYYTFEMRQFLIRMWPGILYYLEERVKFAELSVTNGYVIYAYSYWRGCCKTFLIKDIWGNSTFAIASAHYVNKANLYPGSCNTCTWLRDEGIVSQAVLP
jgi:hypothetical protein